MTMQIFAISPGWKLKGPSFSQMRLPRISWPRPGIHERIFVLRETVDVAHDRQSDHHTRDAHEQPDDLAYRQIGREARDECDADAGKAECDGQNGRISVFRKEAGGDVRHHKRGKQAEGRGERFERKRRALPNEHHGEQQHNERRRQAQKQQFGIATAHYLSPPFPT